MGPQVNCAALTLGHRLISHYVEMQWGREKMTAQNSPHKSRGTPASSGSLAPFAILASHQMAAGALLGGFHCGHVIPCRAMTHFLKQWQVPGLQPSAALAGSFIRGPHDVTATTISPS